MRPTIVLAIGFSLLAVLVGTSFGSALRQSYDAKILRATGCEEIRSSTSSCRISVQIENAGTADWDSGNFRLVGKIVRGPSGSPVQRDELAHDDTRVSLEARRRDYFTYTVEGTDYVGTYEIEWCMARSSGSRFEQFGDCLTRTITVAK